MHTERFFASLPIGFCLNIRDLIDPIAVLQAIAIAGVVNAHQTRANNSVKAIRQYPRFGGRILF